MDEIEVKKLLRKSSYPFLGADENEWINSDGEIKQLREMNYEYLKNSYNYLLKQKENIEYGFCLQGVKFDRSQYDEILKIVKKLYENKVKELEKYL